MGWVGYAWRRSTEALASRVDMMEDSLITRDEERSRIVKKPSRTVNL